MLNVPYQGTGAKGLRAECGPKGARLTVRAEADSLTIEQGSE